MAQPSTIKNHPKRAEIDRALAAGGESQRSIATRFGVSRQALDRYVKSGATAAPEAPGGIPAPPAPADAPTGAGAPETANAGAGPAAPDSRPPPPGDGSQERAGAVAADPAPSRYEGATEPISGARAVLYVNGSGPATAVLRLPAGDWTGDAGTAARAILGDALARRRAGPVNFHDVLRRLPHGADDPRGVMFGNLLRSAGADLAAPSWSIRAAALLDTEPLAVAIAGAEREAAELAEQKRIAEIRNRPAQLRVLQSADQSRHRSLLGTAERLRAQLDATERHAAALAERMADREAVIEEAEDDAAELAPLPAAPPPEPRPDLEPLAARNRMMAERNAARASGEPLRRRKPAKAPKAPYLRRVDAPSPLPEIPAGAASGAVSGPLPERPAGGAE